MEVGKVVANAAMAVVVTEVVKVVGTVGVWEEATVQVATEKGVVGAEAVVMLVAEVLEVARVMGAGVAEA